MSRSKRKRNRRHWKKEDDVQDVKVCTCHAEKYKGVHIKSCPLFADPECNCNSENYNGSHIASCPASYSNTKYGTDFTGTKYAGDWGGSFCAEVHWRKPVLLLEDKTIFASAWSDRPKTSGPLEEQPIDFGFYLDDLWTGNRMTASPGLELPITAMSPQVIHFPCTDQQSPPDLVTFKAMMEWILEQIGEGKNVDVGCIGGHGRTGLTLSCLLVAQGMDPWKAITKIRDEYCSEAVETYTQEKFVGKMWSAFNEGEEPPESPLVKKWGSTTTTSYTTQEPIMDHCPECKNAVYYLDTHRGMCHGHPTDEELEAAVEKATRGLSKAKSHPCPRDGCEFGTVYDQSIHDKAIHGITKNAYDKDADDVITNADKALQQYHEEVMKATDEQMAQNQMVREHYDDTPHVSEDEDEYQEWLRLNAQGLKDAGMIESLEGEIVASVDGDEWDKRMSQMNDACPFGECKYPFECEPHEGMCWRQETQG